MKEDLSSPRDIDTSGLQQRFDAYIRRVIKNSAFDLVRKETRRLALEQLAGCIIAGEQMPEYIGDLTVAEFTAGCQKLAVTDERLKDTLGKLSKRKRDVLILSTAFGYSYAEISETLGISKATVKSIKYKALRDIRRMLAEKPL